MPPMASHDLDIFADIAISALNLQPDQPLVIKAEPEHIHAVEAVATRAYRAGAPVVDIWIESSRLARARLDHGHPDSWARIPSYRAARNRAFIDERWALLSIKSPWDPSVLSGVAPDRSAAYQGALGSADLELRRALGDDRMQWTVMALPAPEWAASILGVAPDADGEEALWAVLRPILRMDQANPGAWWQQRGRELRERAALLNEDSVVSLRFEGPGTDLTVRLADGARWKGGGTERADGVAFLPNVPTEEVFTAPHRRGVEGRVAATRPLRVFGRRVAGAWFEFREGRVTDFGADENAAVLGAFLDVDEGSRSMGEIALVDGSSPIAQSGVVFENILLDENAACHFALGSAYPSTLAGGETMDDQSLEAHGANLSRQHHDIMFGSDEVSVRATARDGHEWDVMRDGVWLGGRNG